MTRRLACALMIGLLLASLTSAQTDTRVKVVGQRINLRARADVQSEVVGQAADGDLLQAKSFQDEWVEVVAPDSVDLWVQRDFMKDGAVTASKLNIRAGAGINFSVVGSLGKGDLVTRRGDFGEWVKIAPPPCASLWVNRSYVQVLQPEKEKPPVVAAPPKPAPITGPTAAPPETPAPAVAASTPGPIVMTPGAAPRSVSVVTETPEPPAVKAPADLVLIPLAGQGRSVQRDGTLQLSGFVLRQPSRYRLVQQNGRRFDTLCYVRGNNAQLSGFVGQRLLIRGREYWVKGVRSPVVVPEQIIPKAGP